MIRFGPSGNSEKFYEDGHKSSVEAPLWLNTMGLRAYEYSFSLGQFLSDEKCKIMYDEAQKYDIKISAHAPYYINFCNTTEQSKENNKKFLLNSAHCVKLMGGNHVVFHTGAQMKMTREEALNNVERNLKDFLEIFESNAEYDGVLLCPETMGKYSQVGNPTEVYHICTYSKRLVPTLDFGHINCLMQGGLKTKQDYKDILQQGIDILGPERMQNFHIHFAKIKFNEKGEIAHQTLSDVDVGPNFEPMIEALIEMGLEPDIISESKGTQAIDAKKMNDYYTKIIDF